MKEVLIKTARIVAAIVLCQLALMVSLFAGMILHTMVLGPENISMSYEAHVAMASPIVNAVVSFPVFFAMARVLVRWGRNEPWWALGIFLVWHAILIFSMSDDLVFYGIMWVVGSVMKTAGVYVAAGRPGESAHATTDASVDPAGKG